jgi:uncharacterized protein YecE (DUF72 family)
LVHAVDPFEQESAFGATRYYRLHGKSLGGYRYDYNYAYSEAELERLHCRCTEAPTYCMFNNKRMAVDARRFEQLNAGAPSVL